MTDTGVVLHVQTQDGSTYWINPATGTVNGMLFQQLDSGGEPDRDREPPYLLQPRQKENDAQLVLTRGGRLLADEVFLYGW